MTMVASVYFVGSGLYVYLKSIDGSGKSLSMYVLTLYHLHDVSNLSILQAASVLYTGALSLSSSFNFPRVS